MTIGHAYGPKVKDPLTTTDELHEQIHLGLVWASQHLETIIGRDATHSMMIRVPAGIYMMFENLQMHLGAGDVLIEFFEGITVSADGTPMPIFNRNRIAMTSPLIGLFDSPIITDAGVALSAVWIPPTGTGTGNSVPPGMISQGSGKWILKDATDYALSITNLSAIDIKAWIRLDWHEVLPEDI